MALLTVYDLGDGGVDAVGSFASAGASGDLVPNGGGDVFLLVKNASGSLVTVTVPAQKTSMYREGFGTVDVPDYEATVAATTGAKLLGPFGRARYNNGNGQITVQYSATSSVTVKAFRFPRV